MHDTTERFLRDIADRVGYTRVTEIHLFPALKQGGIESGVAVVAADPEEGSAADVAAPDAAAPVAVQRHVIYTARYRQTLKGPDRGKWEIDVTAEADAPLVTVDQVVRGVVFRSGDAAHPERITGEQFRAIVPAPAALATEPASPAPHDTPPPDSACE